MREIKFRAKKKVVHWIEKYTKSEHIVGEFVYGSLLDLGSDDIYIVQNNDFVEDRVYDEAHKEAVYMKVYRETAGQYIGPKDKNGVEIYEGDILLSPEGAKAEIKYVIEHAAFLAYWKHNGDRGYEYLEGDGKLKQALIIGNIYENPELLEGA